MRTGIAGICSVFTLVLMLAACGGGSSSGGGDSADIGDDGSGNANALTGVFIDSAVSGLRWTSDSFSGTTDTNGTFRYLSGEFVSFYVGDIWLGTASGDSVIMPLDLVPGARDISCLLYTSPSPRDA